MPSNAYTSTEFLDCEGDLQMPPGQYISDGTSNYICSSVPLVHLIDLSTSRHMETTCFSLPRYDSSLATVHPSLVQLHNLPECTALCSGSFSFLVHPRSYLDGRRQETGSLSTVATATTTSGAAPAGGPSGSGPTPAPTAAHTTTSGNAVPTHGAQVGMAAAAFAVAGAILA